MSKKNFKGAFFDLDGTLLDTIGDIHYNLNTVLSEFGYPLHTKEEARSYVNNGALSLITKALPESERGGDVPKRVLERYLEIYDERLMEKTVPYEGITELIKRLKSEGVSLAVISNKPERHVKLLSEAFFGEGTFSYVSGTGGDKPVKPDRECVDTALKSLQLSQDDAVFIGDSDVDVRTGRGAGLFTVGVTWGFHGKSSFKSDNPPDVFVENAAELYGIIRGGES